MAEPIVNTLGIVGMKHCGVYDSTTNYEKLNVVNYQGSSYCAKTNTVGNLPTETEYWDLLARKGDQGNEGPEGPEGPKPVKGVDYFTAEDIADLESTIGTDVAEEVSDMLGSLTSATPLVASSTSEMTDTTRVYVNTTDGHWYWYNGSAWTDGGIYQATEVEDGSITYDKLSTELSENLVPFTELVAGTVVKGSFIQADGSVASASATGYISISVNPGDVFYVTIPYLTATFGSNQPLYMFKNSGSVVSYVKGGDVTFVDNKYRGIIEIPEGVDELLINESDSLSITDKLSITKLNNYSITNIGKNQLDEALQSVFSNEYESVTPTLYVSGAYMGTSRPDQITGAYYIYKLEVNPGEKYIITSKQIYNNPLLTFGNANSKRTYTLNNVDYEFQSTVDEIKGESQQQFVNYEFTIPSNCNVIYLNKYSTQELTVKKLSGYGISITDDDVARIKTQINPLNEKTLMFVGDSICAASTAGVKGWWRLIQENNPTATVYNYGQDGATIAQNGRDNNDVYTKIQTMHTDHPDADYIIIQGGVNDIWQSIPLGEFSKNSNFNNNPTYDTTTFSGALEWIFNYCLNNFPGKKIGYIVTQKVYGSGAFWDYMDRAKEICEKWSIPYVDLYNEGDLNFYVTSHKQNYSITTVYAGGDGCHPNLAGYQIITPKIENWLKYKI